MSRSQHDRTDLHTGLDSALVIVLSNTVGSQPVGTDLHAVLSYIDSWISDRETITPEIRSFTASSVILSVQSGSITANSVVRRLGIPGSLTADAFVQPYIKFNAVVLATLTGSFTIGSDVVGPHYFYVNAVIVTDAAAHAFDFEAFDPTAFV